MTSAIRQLDVDADLPALARLLAVIATADGGEATTEAALRDGLA